MDRGLAVGLLILVAAACTPGDRLGAGHPPESRIYEVASGRFVDQATLVDDLASADFVLLGERHDNPDHHRLQALLIQALESKWDRPRAVAFEIIPRTRRLLSRPPAINCWVWAKNSISRMPPRPSLTLCPPTRASPRFLEMLISRFIA